MPVFCVYVEKKREFAGEARAVLADLKNALKVEGLTEVRLLNRYFVEGVSAADFAAARDIVFSEPPVDDVYNNLPEFGASAVFAVEPLPGQFDQRADSCAQCVSLATGKSRPAVRAARVYALEGKITADELEKIKRYLISPVECREASLEIPETLNEEYPVPEPVKILGGFRELDDGGLRGLQRELSLAMDADDLACCRDYFRAENRDPSLTEIRVLDTYWSDHCRHTTFLTRLGDIAIETPEIMASYKKYLRLREKLYSKKDKPVTLMDLATIGAKALKSEGLLKELDESDEINACTVKITVDRDGVGEDWLLLFKNETHNHPTEIEPFGGAATCLGGAIRDPLSGRGYVYQAMRLTGAANPLAAADETRAGKLPQRKLTQTAAAGYSSYGNQIGVATGHVHEIYHPGYEAKRMELGAVLGAAPAANVRREVPAPGDAVILLGGRTGRDGCGGAAGSSKSHTGDSLATCGAEVQKGNAPEERKLQRLFRDPDVTRLIKRCNDFGAGGVSVAIGELADGLLIDLDAVPKKYDGLDGTELAISESQERMAVVVAATDADAFIALASRENLEATVVARVTAEPRLVMRWQNREIVNLSRAFLDTNGAPKFADVKIAAPKSDEQCDTPVTADGLLRQQASLGFCSQKGLIDRFDSTVGAGTVLMPLGGANQLSPSQAMAAKIPVLGGETTTCSVMAWGFLPELSERSPYHGGIAAVTQSLAKIIAAGGSRRSCWLSFQEYFERLGGDPGRWGKPFAALLGALEAQLAFRVGAVGGKDSMSGSFDELDVPPTLVSFAVSVTKTGNILPQEFQSAGSGVYLLEPENESLESVAAVFDTAEKLIASGAVLSARALGAGGTADAVCKMCYGNNLGFSAELPLSQKTMTGFLLECRENPGGECKKIGTVEAEPAIKLHGGGSILLKTLLKLWETTLQSVFPVSRNLSKDVESLKTMPKNGGNLRAAVKIAKPRVLIPVFPGTNCEFDTARAFEKAGAKTEIFVIRNLTPAMIAESAAAFAESLARAQIVAVPGGFSGGDEPDGSGKFIVAFFRNPRISGEINRLLRERDGLMCGICNGFQALLKLGLVPFGEIRDACPESPTLTLNEIGRHQSMIVRTRILSNRSPWLQKYAAGEVFATPVSHGEGRFIAPEAQIAELFANGQVASVYLDNPNGSMSGIEGLTSADGRVFGKMAHCERYGGDLYKNIPGNKLLDMFSGAVDYYG